MSEHSGYTDSGAELYELGRAAAFKLASGEDLLAVMEWQRQEIIDILARVTLERNILARANLN